MNLLTTLRSPRIGKFAIFDFVTAFAGMYYLAPYVGLKPRTGLLLTIPTGLVVHLLLGIETPLTNMIKTS